MVITLSGITGVGKSYLKKEIQKRLKIEPQVIVTTRKKRKDETDGIDKKFVTENEFENLEKQKDIIEEINTVIQENKWKIIIFLL